MSYNNLENLNNIIIVSGDDYYLSIELINDIISNLPEGKKDIDYIPLSEEDKLSNQLFECFNMPFISKKRIIYLNRTQSLNKEDKIAFEKYINKPSDCSVLLILDTKRLFKNFYKNKNIKFIEKNRLDNYSLINRIAEYCKGFNTSIDRQAATLLVEYTDRYISRIDTELMKLIAYTRDKKQISRKDIEECVQPESDYQIYQFINAIIKGNNNTAIYMNEKLLQSGIAPIVLLSSLIHQLRKLLHLSLNKKNNNINELATLLKIPSFALSREMALAKICSQKKLKQLIDKLYDYEISFKSGKMTDLEAYKTAISEIVYLGVIK